MNYLLQDQLRELLRDFPENNRFNDQELRFNILKRAIEHAERSIYTIVLEVFDEKNRGKFLDS